jgi:fused signal recognition particle receptor
LTIPANTGARGVRPTGLLDRLREHLAATRRSLGRTLGGLLRGTRTLDAGLLEELEAALLSADIGVETTQALIADVSAHFSRREPVEAQAVYDLLRQKILAIVQPGARPLTVAGIKPFIVMVVGVNGVGKTTTIAKLARRLANAGHKVMLAAADTFRAAAVEQLKVWGERLDVPVVAQHSGADAAAVAHDAVTAARTRGADVLIVDTAGRQHTHAGLMEELKKIRRVLGKLDASAPHEVLLVLDAGTGQNALSQLEHFRAAVGVTGIALTKLDGTAKGGILIAIAKKTALPIRFLGLGEGLDDLRPFDAAEYVDAILPARPESATEGG